MARSLRIKPTLIVVAGSVALACLAQQRPQPTAPLNFDVASVKPSTLPWMEIAPRRTGGRIGWTTDLWYLTMYAYRLQRFQISGPLPGSDHTYSIEATTNAASTDDEVRRMFQSLLADRFHMATHWTTKDADGYVLSVAKNGPKIKPVPADVKAPPLPEWLSNSKTPPADLEGKVLTNMPAAGVTAIAGRRVSMSQFCEALGRLLQAVVTNETGLQGSYYFGLQYAMEGHPADVDLPPLLAAIQEDLGLKLEKRKGPIDVLIVDRIEKVPTDN